MISTRTQFWYCFFYILYIVNIAEEKVNFDRRKKLHI